MDARWPVEIYGIEPIAHLGAGGFGQVWLANQTDLDRKVAVKISHIPFSTEDDKRRFERECKALGQLGGHPHIIEVYTSGISNNLPYLVLQYVDGGTLADGVHTLVEPELRTITNQLCQAVSAAHTRGVLHRDLKPENVFLQQDRTVILGDFGIARLGDGNNTSAMGVTGSMAFVAPEVLQGHEPSAQADVYGIGITIISAILGRSPFLEPGATNIHTIISKVIEAQPPNLTASGLTPAYQNLLLRTINPNPDQRPQTVDQLRTELSQLPPPANNQQPSPTPSSQQTAIAPPSQRPQFPAPAQPVAPPGPQTFSSQPIPAPPQQPMPAHQPAPAPPQQPMPAHQPAPAPQPMSAPRYNPASAQAPVGASMPFSATPPTVQNTPPSGAKGAGNGGGGGRGPLIAMGALGVGSLLVLAVLFTTLTGNDDMPETLAGTVSTTSLVADESTQSDSVGPDDDLPPSSSTPSTTATTTPTTTETTARTGPLNLPLNSSQIMEVTGLSDEAEGWLDFDFGEGETTVCNEPSVNEGVLLQVGQEFPETHSDSDVYRSVGQSLKRFDTVDQATAYVDNESGAVCDAWEEEIEGPILISYQPTPVTTSVAYGDQMTAYDTTITFPNGEGQTIYVRGVLIRSGADTFELFFLSVEESEVASITDELLEVAVQGLDY